MNKTTKIIVSIAVTVVLAASIVTISLFKESEPTTQQPSFSVPSTTLIYQPTETESWFDWDAYINSLDLSTEPESSTVNPSDPTATVPPTQNIIISYVYPNDYVPGTTQGQKPETTEKPTKNNTVQMVDYKYTITGDSVTITSYFGSNMSPVIPAEINGLPVSKIGYECFKGKPITSVYIPSTVHVIDISAFAECKKLQKVYFLGDDSSVEICPAAFRNCKNLVKIGYGITSDKNVLPQATASIGANAFSGCTALMKLTVPAEATVHLHAFTETNENLTIYCKQDSEAQAAASFAGIKVVCE